MLLQLPTDAADREVVRVAGRGLTGGELRAAAATVAAGLPAGGRVLVPVGADLESVVAVVAGLVAGATVVPVNGRAGEREVAHQVADSDPDLVLAPAGADLVGPLAGLDVVRVDVDGLRSAPEPPAGWPAPVDDDGPALVMYTSGTTGPPKGAVLSHRALAANLDALATTWRWTADDVLVHALPLYHVHGLVLGVLGALQVGSRLVHLGRFGVDDLVAALDAGGTMVFGVPTMYSRLADRAEADPSAAAALRRARLLVSGSAGLPPSVRQRLRTSTGHVVVERYGMTETLILTGAPAPRPAPPGGVEALPCVGPVGPPLPGVELRLVDDAGAEVPSDGSTMGAVEARTPALFEGYRNRPDATAAFVVDGWARTGDVAVRHPDGSLTIVGRQSSDIIKTGGFKVGAGEVEDALLEHPAVAECAVVGVPDDDLGQAVAAWVVLAAGAEHPDDPATVLGDHVSALLAAHKRPRQVHVVPELPRNAMGKVQKQRLLPASPPTTTQSLPP